MRAAALMACLVTGGGAAADPPAGGDAVESALRILADAGLEPVLDRIEPAPLGDHVLRGHLDEEPGGWFILALNDGAVMGEVSVPRTGHVHVRWTAGGGRVVRRIPGDRRLSCLTAAGSVAAKSPEAAPAEARQAAVPAGPVVIDVMIVYTPSSRKAVGGRAAIEALIDSYFAYTDAVFGRSGIAHRFRLVHAAETDYVESGNSLTDLERLKDPADGFMDEVHGLRDRFGADLVSLINTSGSAGAAYAMTELSIRFADCAFSAIGADTGPIPGGLVFAHETGHNMGSQHNHTANPPPAIFCYSYGYRTPDEQWRTIMSSPPGTFVDFFSSPDLQFMGQPLGVPGEGCPPDAADNVSSLNEAAPTVARFRPTVVPLPCDADLDGDGQVGVTDLILLLAAWGDAPGGPPDLNGDGIVGIGDLLLLLSSWGPCPR